MKIGIDFISGSHGNYLEFILTKLMFPEELPASPFNNLGASHNKNYTRKVFFAEHWFLTEEGKKTIPNDIISIRFTADDLLILMSVSLLRAGDQNIHNNELHINTYNKLSGCYKDTLNNILTSYKDNLSEVNENNPNIPRNILREFFKFGFCDPSNSGFIKELSKLTYTSKQKVYYFPYSSFLSTDKFLTEISRVGKFFNLDYQPYDLRPLHEKFLSNYQFISIKKNC
jgi:hypothetical protein